jgi:hypothetical protein
MYSRYGVRPKANSSSNHSVRTHRTLMLSTDPEDNSWASRTHRSGQQKLYGVDGHGSCIDRRNGAVLSAESGSLYGSAQSVSRNTSRHAIHKKSKSEYLNRKLMPVASPEADDEDEDYQCGRSTNRDHRIWDKYCQQNFRATVGPTPSRVRWDYREGVSIQ